MVDAMRRLAAHVCRDLALAGLLAAIVLVGLGAWRLTKGPISLAFAKPYFAQALNPMVAPDRVRMDDVVLRWGGWRQPLQIRVLAPALVDGAERIRARLPEASVSLGFGALLAGRLEPSRITLIGPRIAAERTWPRGSSERAANASMAASSSGQCPRACKAGIWR